MRIFHVKIFLFKLTLLKVLCIKEQVILEGHLNHCVREGIEHGDSEKTIEKYTKAIEQFSRK